MSKNKNGAKKSTIKNVNEKKEFKAEKEVKKDSEVIYKSSKNSKGNKLGLVLIILLAALIIVTSIISVSEVQTVDTPEVTSAELSTWAEETAADQYTITVIGLSYCGHCHNYQPHIASIAEENNIKLFWYDIDTLETSEQDYLTSTYAFDEYTGASPYTAVMYAGEVIAQHVGELDEDGTREFLQEAGVIE